MDKIHPAMFKAVGGPTHILVSVTTRVTSRHSCKISRKWFKFPQDGE